MIDSPGLSNGMTSASWVSQSRKLPYFLRRRMMNVCSKISSRGLLESGLKGLVGDPFMNFILDSVILLVPTPLSPFLLLRHFLPVHCHFPCHCLGTQLSSVQSPRWLTDISQGLSNQHNPLLRNEPPGAMSTLEIFPLTRLIVPRVDALLKLSREPVSPT